MSQRYFSGHLFNRVVPPPLGWKQWLLLIVILAFGVVVRSRDLGAWPLWVEEAVSSINALTILEHGVPVDHYLGQPIYETTLVRPWPESEEYEFKDSSYSSRGLAVYHGWLPLYAMAASFAMHGIAPDADPTDLRVHYTRAEMHRRTMAARLPSVLFGLLFLVAVFFAAREWYGPDAAWTALLGGATSLTAIWFARQAHYYSATAALTTCCAWMFGRILRRGRWRDFLLGGVALILLFYTHTLSFAVACAVFVLVVPALRQHRRCVAKLAALGAVVALGTWPWIAHTGFNGTAADVPKAWPLLSRQDLLSTLQSKSLVLTLAAGWVLIGLFRGKLACIRHHPLAYRWESFWFLAAWVVIAFLAFAYLIPAASYFQDHLTLITLTPAFLFGAMLCTAVARLVMVRYSALLASILFFTIQFCNGQAVIWWGAVDPATKHFLDVVEYLGALNIQPGTRIYTNLNDHLAFTFYTGMPVQHVAAVRKSFLNSYEGEILILEAPRYEYLNWWEIQRYLLAMGQPVSEWEARGVEDHLSTRLVREELTGQAASVSPPLNPVPEYCRQLLIYQRLKTMEAVAKHVERFGNPLLKGYQFTDYRECWQTFFCRFVKPESRTGKNANYMERVREAHASILPLEWVLYHCPARTSDDESVPAPRTPETTSRTDDSSSANLARTGSQGP